ncbi:MAG: PAS domain S-box protein [Acidobacteria bacterium]|nr:PAS domain S-box protein [Acidobacteriota bacterium]
MTETGENIRILHVDDNQEYLDLIEIRLPIEEPIFQIEKAVSVDEALKHLNQSEYHCILADYNMPVKNGLELLRAIRDKDLMIPFIFLTGQGNEDVAAEAFRSGADDYFTKDATFAHFILIINSIKQNVAKYKHIKQEYQATINLRKNEEYLKALLSSLDDVIFVFDMDGVFTDFYLSQEGFRTLLAPQDFLGKKVDDVMGPNVVIPLREAFVKAGETNQMYEFEYNLMLDNETRWYTARVSQILDPQGIPSGYIAAVSDVTDMKVNREKLAESESLYKFILENAFDYIYCVDYKTKKYIFISPKVTEVYDVPLSEIMSTKDFALTQIPKIDHEYIINEMKKREEMPDQEHFISFRIFNKSHELRYVEQRSKVVTENGKPKYILGVFRDITDLKAHEQFAKQRQQDYLDIVACLLESIVSIINADGLFTRVYGNEELLKKWKINTKKMIGRDVWSLIENKYTPKLRDKLEEQIRDQNRGIFKLKVIANGIRYYAEINIVPIIENDNCDKYAVLMRDITSQFDKSTDEYDGVVDFDKE